MSDDFSLIEKDLLLFDTEQPSNEPLEIGEADPFPSVSAIDFDDEPIVPDPKQNRSR